MDLDDHDQLQNDNGEIDVGGCVETWRKKKRIEREGGGGGDNMLLPTYFL